MTDNQRHNRNLAMILSRLEGSTLEEIGVKEGMSREAARRAIFSTFRKLSKADKQLRTMEAARNKVSPSDILDRSIHEIPWSARTEHCLTKANVRTVRELCNKTIRDLERIKGLGSACLREIQERLAMFSLGLGNETLFSPIATERLIQLEKALEEIKHGHSNPTKSRASKRVATAPRSGKRSNSVQ